MMTKFKKPYINDNSVVMPVLLWYLNSMMLEYSSSNYCLQRSKFLKLVFTKQELSYGWFTI